MLHTPLRYARSNPDSLSSSYLTTSRGVISMYAVTISGGMGPAATPCHGCGRNASVVVTRGDVTRPGRLVTPGTQAASSRPIPPVVIGGLGGSVPFGLAGGSTGHGEYALGPLRCGLRPPRVQDVGLGDVPGARCSLSAVQADRASGLGRPSAEVTSAKT